MCVSLYLNFFFKREGGFPGGLELGLRTLAAMRLGSGTEILQTPRSVAKKQKEGGDK